MTKYNRKYNDKERQCYTCKIIKPVNSFHRKRGTTRYQCKVCHNKYSAEWRRKNGIVIGSTLYVQVGLRWMILKRDNFTCCYCGRKAPNVELEIDHKIPISSGGLTTEENLVVACLECNQGKRDSLL